MNDQDIEAEVQAKGLTSAPRITPADIEAAIFQEHYFTAEHGIYGAAAFKADSEMSVSSVVFPSCAKAHAITFCVLILNNGFVIVGVNTGPVNIENFDEELGRKLARQHAIDQLWPLFGYALACRQAG